MGSDRRPTWRSTAWWRTSATASSSNSEKVGVAERGGEILEVIPHEIRAEYRVRWDDGHESGIRPYASSIRIEPSARKRAPKAAKTSNG